MKTFTMRPIVILCFLLCQVIQLPAQQNHKRLALVIGNADYQHGGALKNPVNDANLMSRTLEDLGFDVIRKTNADLKAMQGAFKKFVTRMNKYDVALFFYAGHGMQVDGQNYLIPVDAQLEDKLSIEFEAFKVSSVNRYFSYNGDKLNIMILDACRNNPYRAWMRGGGQGFTAIDEQGAGTIIAFATREGETASDGTGSNGLFTEYLVEQMKVPQNITDVFQNTRVSVLKASNEQQVPQEWNMLTGNFYFTQQKSLQNTADNEVTNGNPVFVSGKISVDYGSIIIDTPIGGDLYLDGNQVGYLQANSTGNQLNQIKTGVHIVKIEGSETVSQEIVVYKNRTTSLDFAKEKEILESGSSFTDSRDNRVYKSVQIGNQVWMAENMDYSMEGSYSNENGDRLYTWDAAIKACPEGWHLPTNNEWDILMNHFGSYKKAGIALKSTSGWFKDRNGSNSSGFTALPAGFRSNKGSFQRIGKVGNFWTASERDESTAWFRVMSYFYVELVRSYYYKSFGYSCRCLED